MVIVALSTLRPTKVELLPSMDPRARIPDWQWKTGFWAAFETEVGRRNTIPTAKQVELRS